MSYGNPYVPPSWNSNSSSISEDKASLPTEGEATIITTEEEATTKEAITKEAITKGDTIKEDTAGEETTGPSTIGRTGDKTEETTDGTIEGTGGTIGETTEEIDMTSETTTTISTIVAREEAVTTTDTVEKEAPTAIAKDVNWYENIWYITSWYKFN